ncbi:unnamed protein product [Adineta ricciae]|uniref:F-box domain-containing protein n=1 Tax=Adineta ricciae TaxID=249248 RepID=A0A816EI02_ADIRI|nr:unnamed protein product [Adineta ricciae]CAF1649463.1 unnamed protein product [Adineta ricciae]
MSLRRTLNSRIEDLPTEIIFVVFDHLYFHEIINAFRQLNSYFQSLLQTYQQYYLDLSVLRRIWHFEVIQQLPKYIQQVKSLRLASREDLIIDTNQYLTLYPLNLYYSTLELLSLTGTDVDQLESFVFKLSNFQRLKHLSLILYRKYDSSYSMSDSRLNLLRFILLFKIKTLMFLSWNVGLDFFSRKYMTLSNEKSTIEFYEFYGMSFDDLTWLQLYTTNMKSLSIHKFTCDFGKVCRLTIETLITLKLHDIPESMNIHQLFKQCLYLPQLNHLELEGELFKGSHIDGNHWRYLIENCVPHIKRFRFFFYINDRIVSKPHNNIIESYKTDFWLRDKKWFVNCDYLAGHRVFLYTLPCIKPELNYLVPYERTSTSSSSAISVPVLHLDSINTNHLPSNLHFDRVRSLSIYQTDRNMTYEQLRRLINISTVEHLIFLDYINPDLFFDILKYHPTQLSIRMCEQNFHEVLGISYGFSKKQLSTDRMAYLEKIKSFKLKWCSGSNEGALESCAKFSKLEALEIDLTMSVAKLQYIINSFTKLSFLKMCQGDDINKLIESGSQWRRLVHKRVNSADWIWFD